MRRAVGLGLLVALLAALIGAPLAIAYTGEWAHWASKVGDFLSQNFAGTQVGYDAGITYVGNNGTMHLGPGSDEVVTGTIPNGVLVLQKTVDGYLVRGTPLRWFSRVGAEKAVLDSAGVTADGRVAADSLRGDLGMFIGGEKITKIKKGTFTCDFGNVTAGETLDQNFSGITGLDAASAWVVFVSPTASMTAGVALGSATVLTNDNITLRCINTCGLDVNPASVTMRYVAFK